MSSEEIKAEVAKAHLTAQLKQRYADDKLDGEGKPNAAFCRERVHDHFKAFPKSFEKYKRGQKEQDEVKLKQGFFNEYKSKLFSSSSFS